MASTHDPAPRKRGRATGLVVALSALVVAAGVLYGLGRPGKEEASACPAAQATLARLDPLIHGEIAALSLKKPARVAPDFTFQGPDGKSLHLADFRGRTVLLNFWATWCVPCRQEMPALDRLQAAQAGGDFQVVAVNVDTAKLDRPRAFLKDNRIEQLAFYADPSGDVLQVLKDQTTFIGLPTTLLIDRNGCEIGVMAGPAEWASPEAQDLIRAAKAA